MDKLYFTGIVERSEDGYYVSFPDLPGCVAGGDTMQAAAASAEAALQLHIAGMIEDGELIPAPSDPAALPADPDVTEVSRLVLGVETEGLAKIRINVMLDRNLVKAIDAHSSNRSRFLSEAARDKLRELVG